MAVGDLSIILDAPLHPSDGGSVLVEDVDDARWEAGSALGPIAGGDLLALVPVTPLHQPPAYAIGGGPLDYAQRPRIRRRRREALSRTTIEAELAGVAGGTRTLVVVVAGMVSGSVIVADMLSIRGVVAGAVGINASLDGTRQPAPGYARLLRDDEELLAVLQDSELGLLEHMTP